jgi:SprT protein
MARKTKVKTVSKPIEPLIRLLTPELRKEVEDRQEECYLLAEKHFKCKIPRPTVRYDIRSRTAGLACSGELIRYNLILLFENKADFIENTVPHEVAHRVNHNCNKPAPGKKRLMPHGKEWKAIMTDVFKLKADRTHSYDTTSIQMKPRRKKSSKARVDTAIHVIRSVLTRVEKRFTPEERQRFMHKLDDLVRHEGTDWLEAA